MKENYKKLQKQIKKLDAAHRKINQLRLDDSELAELLNISYPYRSDFGELYGKVWEWKQSIFYYLNALKCQDKYTLQDLISMQNKITKVADGLYGWKEAEVETIEIINGVVSFYLLFSNVEGPAIKFDYNEKEDSIDVRCGFPMQFLDD